MYEGSRSLLTVLLVGIFCFRLVISVKLKLASEHDCDRYSLEALYYEQYTLQTANAFADIKKFVNSAADRMLDSLIEIMADLPGRESSDMEERRVHVAFDEMKRKFGRSVDKLKNNITSAWESLIEAHYSLMLDDGRFTLGDVLNRTNYVADSYIFSRYTLDTKLGSVISGMKDIIRHSMQGITAVAETEIKNEEIEKSKKSNTSQASDNKEDSDDAVWKDTESGGTTQKFNSSELLKNKKKEMVESLAPGFLGKVSVIIIDRGVNLTDEVTTKSEDRDSLLDDMYFALVMIRSRVNSIIHKDAPKTKEARDLARRNLYIYFADKAAEMYKDRIEKKRGKPSTDSDERQQSWKNEDDLAEALVTLMENYP